MPAAIGSSSKGQTSSALNLTTSPTVSTNSGSLIVAAVAWDTGTFSSFTDSFVSPNNTYTLIGTQQTFWDVSSPNGLCRLYYVENAVGNASHAWRFVMTGTASAITIGAVEITGLETTGALYTFNFNAIDTASPWTGDITPSAGDRLLLLYWANGQTGTPSTEGVGGWTKIDGASNNGSASTWAVEIYYKIVAADGSTAYSASFTGGNTDRGRLMFASFKIAATNTAPTITIQPISVTYYPTDTVTFTSAASGTPTPNLKWQVNTGSTWADISGATSNTYTTGRLEKTSSGHQYRMQANNSLGTANSNAATITFVQSGMKIYANGDVKVGQLIEIAGAPNKLYANGTFVTSQFIETQ